MSASPVRIIALAGGSCSGKTTLAANLHKALTPAVCAMVPLDNYYRDRGTRAPETINYDHPEAFELSLLAKHLAALRNGSAIDMPQYDFHTHHRKPRTETLHPKPVIIVEGILALCDSQLNQCYDLRVFIDSDAHTRRERRLQRDVRERGRSEANILTQLQTQVEPMYEAYVGPSASHADLQVPAMHTPADLTQHTQELLRWCQQQPPRSS